MIEWGLRNAPKFWGLPPFSQDMFIRWKEWPAFMEYISGWADLDKVPVGSGAFHGRARSIIVIIKDEYIYVYYLDMHNNPKAKAFTHKSR